MTEFRHHVLDAPSLGGSAEVVVHGHGGRPVLWFPSEGRSAWEFSEHGMVDALRGPLDDGRIRVFCVSSYDRESWSARHKPMADRAAAHLAYEDWIVWQVLPFLRSWCGGRDDVICAGPSMGAFHAVLFALRHAHLFHRAVAFSGSYDPWRWHGFGEGDDLVHGMNPTAFLPAVTSQHLEHLRRSLRFTLVVGEGRWEDTTGARAGTAELAGLFRDRGIDHELHIWGPEWVHDWSSWRVQAPHYLDG